MARSRLLGEYAQLFPIWSLSDALATDGHCLAYNLNTEMMKAYWKSVVISGLLLGMLATVPACSDEFVDPIESTTTNNQSHEKKNSNDPIDRD